MKNLIVYYSLEGNSQYVAETLQEMIGADVLRLVPKKVYKDKGLGKYLWGGRSALMAEKPDLEEYHVNLDQYDRVILGFPVWASTFTPPLRTFVEDHQEELQKKELVAFACQAGTGAEKALTKLADCIGVPQFSKTAIFIDPKGRRSDKTDAAIKAFGESLK